MAQCYGICLNKRQMPFLELEQFHVQQAAGLLDKVTAPGSSVFGFDDLDLDRISGLHRQRADTTVGGVT